MNKIIYKIKIIQKKNKIKNLVKIPEFVQFLYSLYQLIFYYLNQFVPIFYESEKLMIYIEKIIMFYIRWEFIFQEYWILYKEILNVEF